MNYEIIIRFSEDYSISIFGVIDWKTESTENADYLKILISDGTDTVVNLNKVIYYLSRAITQREE